jgi:hypothetical protein
MPIYDPYKEVVQPAKYVAPMDLNLLLKGTQYKQEQSEKNFNEIQGQVNNLLSIPAYGKDKEILNQKLQELQQVMGGLDVTNLETPQAKQQINSLINQFSQDKDVQAVAQRGNSYQNMMAEKQDFDKKGKTYVNSGLRKLNQYYSGDDYIRDVKFSNDGYEAPNVAEAMKKIKELETPEEKQIPDGNGGYTIVKSYNPERLKKTTEQVLSGMPNWEKFNREQLAQKYEGIDIDKYAIEHYTPLQQLSQQNYDAALFGYSNSRPGSEDQKKYALAATKAKQDLDQATSILNNPYHGQAFLETEYQNMKEKAVNDIQNALNFNAEGENKMYRAIEQARGFQHDFAIKAQESANRMKEELYKTQNDLFPYLSKGEQDVFLGKAKGEIDWSNAGKKLLEVKQKESLGSKLDDWQSKKDYEAEYKLNQENRQAIDDYLTKNTTTDDTTPAFQTSAATGERLIKENLSTIIPYIAKLSEEYKNLNASDIDKIEYKDGNYRLHTKGVLSNNQDITPNQLSKALTEWKKDYLKTPELAKPQNSSGKVYKGLDAEGNVIFE